MILLCGGIKGGCGKSTIAVNLAIMRALQGRDVLLVDADTQQTAYDFSLLRNEARAGDAGYSYQVQRGKAVMTEVQRQAGRYEDIIIDAGGRDTVGQRAGLVVCDVFLAPFVPGSFDVWTAGAVGALVEEMSQVNPRLQAYALLNQADHQGSDNAEAAELLREIPSLQFLDTPIGQRKVFRHAAARGLSVVEHRPRDRKAIDEVERLYGRIFENEWRFKQAHTV